MKCFVRTLGLIAFALVSATSFAKTYKYDLTDIRSNNGFIQYPGLDFGQVKTVSLTVNKDPLSTEATINSLEITFPNAAKLLATGFKKLDNTTTYRAVVNDVWVYRQIIVDVKSVDFNTTQITHPIIEVSVSEKSVFIQPETDFKGHPLFLVDGNLRDITASKVVDTVSAIIDGKRVNLSLRENLSFAPPAVPVNGSRAGFVIDALWFSKGQKTFYIPAPVPNTEYDSYDAVALTLQELDGPAGKEYLLGVKFKDANGYELTTSVQPLRPLLDTAYNSPF